MADKQKTLKSSVSISGAGLHTGKEVTITFHPAPENHGYKFKRIDLEGSPVVDANIDYVIDTSRGTSIEYNNARVRTIEHVLAALMGLGIDNTMMEINCVETPVLDGSSKPYIDVLEKAGIVEQKADREYIEITENIHYTYPDKKVEMIALPHSDYRISTMIDYETNVLGTQNAFLDSIVDFKKEISPCRTFVFLHELEYLLQNNLIKGGDLSNAIVFVNRVVSQDELNRLADLLKKPKIQVLEKGILNNTEMHFTNEPARHKLLDVLGDLALLGKPLKAHIIANRPGHQTNVEFAKIIKQHIKQKQSNRIKSYDLTAKPLYDINAIKKILPHRAPFLLVDKILEMSDKHVVGVKNVTMNEPFFVGHFPDEPLMPGVLQVEAMAQVGGIFALSIVPDPQNYLTYFMKMNEVKFRHKVVPGDTLLFDLELASPFRRGICHMRGVVYVGDKIVMEAELVAQIVKKNS